MYGGLWLCCGLGSLNMPMETNVFFPFYFCGSGVRARIREAGKALEGDEMHTHLHCCLCSYSRGILSVDKRPKVTVL